MQILWSYTACMILFLFVYTACMIIYSFYDPIQPVWSYKSCIILYSLYHPMQLLWSFTACMILYSSYDPMKLVSSYTACITPYSFYDPIQLVWSYEACVILYSLYDPDQSHPLVRVCPQYPHTPKSPWRRTRSTARRLPPSSLLIAPANRRRFTPSSIHWSSSSSLRLVDTIWYSSCASHAPFPPLPSLVQAPELWKRGCAVMTAC